MTEQLTSDYGTSLQRKPMMRTILRRTLRRSSGRHLRPGLQRAIALLLVSAVLLPAVAIAAQREDAIDMANTMRGLGYAEQASQVEQLVVGMSDSELQLLDDLNFSEVGAKLKAYLDAKQELDVAEAFVQPPSVGPRSVLSDFDLTTFPPPIYPPQSSTCLNPVGVTSSAQLKVGLKATVFALREALTAADGVQRAAMPACNIIIIAIGIGGNAASACIISGIALGVADGVLAVAENIVDNLIFCDEQVHFAESAASTKRIEHVSHQLETHHVEITEQLATHDVEVQAKLRQAIARATSIERKIDLGLKTQLEVAMDRKMVKRPSIFYEERLEELCDLAQEAIDDLPPGYVLATRAQGLVNIGMQLKATDPKRAADECTRGFSMATTGSTEIQ